MALVADAPKPLWRRRMGPPKPLRVGLRVKPCNHRSCTHTSSQCRLLPLSPLPSLARGGSRPDADFARAAGLLVSLAGRGGGHGDIAGEAADVRSGRTSEARPLTAVYPGVSGPECPQILIWGLGGATALLPRTTAAWRAGAGSRATAPTGMLPLPMLVRGGRPNAARSYSPMRTNNPRSLHRLNMYWKNITMRAR